HTRRQWVDEPERHTTTGHEVSNLGTQRIAAEHYAGVRTTTGHELNVGAHIVGAAAGAYVGGIVDPVHPDRHAYLRAQRIDECIPDRADAGWFQSSASENHFDIRACRRCRRN